MALLVGVGLVAACGGSDTAGTPTDAAVATADTDVAGEPAPVASEPATEQSADQPVADTAAPPATDPADSPVLSGDGRALVSIGDMTVEFTGLSCFFGADAAELSGDDDVSFGAAAESDGAGLGITITETVGIDMLEVFFEPSVGSGELWYTNATQIDPLEAYTFENDRITTSGDFELVVDSEVIRTEEGSMEAIC